MRLYNPKFGNESKAELAKKSRRNTAVFIFLIATILAAITGIVLCIVYKAAWYYYIIDIVGGIILFLVIGGFFAEDEKEYVDIPIEDSESDYIAKHIGDLSPEKIMTNVVKRESRNETGVLDGYAYHGIYRGIAVCECGQIIDLQDITYDVENRSSISKTSENGNIRTYETACLRVKCHCKNCGNDFGEYFTGVTRSTGSIINKHEIFSSHTTTTVTSRDADYDGFVEDAYNCDLELYRQDTERYHKTVAQKTDELRKQFKYIHEQDLKKADALRAKGWYEKSTERTTISDER